MDGSRNEQILIKAFQNIAHQLERTNRQLERIADIFETEQAAQEERWYPADYNHEEDENE